MKTIKIGDEITYIYSGGRTKVAKVENIELDNGEIITISKKRATEIKPVVIEKLRRDMKK